MTQTATDQPISGAATDGVAATPELRSLAPHELPTLLRISEYLRRFVDWVGRFGAWFAVPMILITAFDLGVRKTGVVQIWLVENVSEYFGSTLLQELEWHSHTALFALVLGFGYIWNTHVRVDLVRENLKFRTRAWLEFIGLTMFLVPYLCVVIYFAGMYTYDSWAFNRIDSCDWWTISRLCGEVSPSLVGLGARWIIKGILVFGLFVALVAGISVWLQVAVVLFGPKHLRYPLMTLEWPEDIGTMTEGKERIDLETLVDQVEARAQARRENEAPENTAGANPGGP